jgi:GT2 family glycosyltransferase
VVAPGDRLAAALQRNETLAIAGPVLAYLSEPGQIWCAGVTFAPWTGLTELRGSGMPVRQAYEYPLDCFCFPSAFAVRKASFDAVGGFDAEAFPFLMEEPDLAARIRANGKAVQLVPQAVFWHDMSTADSLARRLHIVAGQAERAFLVGRNRGLFIRRHGPNGVRRLLWLIVWLAGLVPYYIGAILLERERSFISRLRLVRVFLKGVWRGVSGTCP